jgi:hypothetical protein
MKLSPARKKQLASIRPVPGQPGRHRKGGGRAVSGFAGSEITNNYAEGMLISTALIYFSLLGESITWNFPSIRVDEVAILYNGAPVALNNSTHVQFTTGIMLSIHVYVVADFQINLWMLALKFYWVGNRS